MVKELTGNQDNFASDTHNDWNVDLISKQVIHKNGMVIYFYGRLQSDYFGGYPRHLPENLSSIEIAELIRTGFACYENYVSMKLAHMNDNVLVA